jgi:hypothetical protein
MKKIKFEGKLDLGKETVSKLNDGHMNQINGGQANWTWTLFNCASKNCPIPTVYCTSASK